MIAAALSPLRERPFARYFAAVTISAAGSYASVIALAFGVLDAAGPAQLALIFLAREVPIVVLVLAGGVFADRWPRRLVLAGCSFAQAAGQIGAAAVLLVGESRGDTSTGLLAVLAVVNGAASAFSRPATTGLIPQVVSAERLQPANALLGITRRLVGIGGAAFGAGLITAVGAGWALAFDALTFVVAGVLLFTVARNASRSKRPVSPLSDLADGWREVRSRRWLWAMILSFGAFQLCYFPTLLVLGPLVARDHFGGPAAWTAIVSAELLGGIAGGILVARVPATRPLILMAIAALPIVLQITALGARWPVAVIAAATAMGGAGLTISDAVWATTLQRHIPGEALSRVSSFDWLGSVALNPLGYLLVAPIAAALGDRITLLGAAAVLGAATLLPLAMREVRSLQMSAPPQPGAETGPS